MPTIVYFLDDEAALGDIFKEMFDSDEVNVTVFIDAKEAIDACEISSPDIMFIDYRLLGTTGDDVAQSISVNINKILMTGELDVKVSYPFKRIIMKPYKLAELREIILEFIEKP